MAQQRLATMAYSQLRKEPDMAPDTEYEQVKRAVALATKIYDDEAALYLAAALRSLCSEQQFDVFLENLQMAAAK